MPTVTTTKSNSRLYWMIIAAIVIVPLTVAGADGLYRKAYPEPPAERLARAIDAYKSNEIAIAHRLFKSLAAQGNATAEYWLADMHDHGLATAKSMPETVRLLEQSAKHGFAPADLRLGELYLTGLEIAPAPVKALRHLQSAAATGSAKALRLLGQMHALGLGLPLDFVKAYANFAAAADRGDAIAKAERDRLATTLATDQIATASALAKTLVRSAVK